MKIEATSKTLRQLIKEEFIYQVPDYQRKYSWTNIEVNELLTDLEMAKQKNTNHFFGTIVISSEKQESEKKFDIIDGQQRITTSIILFYSLLTMFTEIQKKYNYDLQKRIDKLYGMLVFQDDDGDIKSSKLLLNEINNEFFNEFIIKSWMLPKDQREIKYNLLSKELKIKQSKEIYESYNTILDWLDTKLKNAKTIDLYIEELKAIQDIVLDYFELVVITVENDADAFLIFETLNDRGLDLTSVDLIKNELFKNCSKDVHFEQYKTKWLEMLNNFEDIKHVKSFIRHYWIANYKDVSHLNLFKEIRTYLKGSTEHSKFLIESLRKQSVFYGALVNPNNNNISNKRLLNLLIDMKNLKFDLANPILLTANKIYNGDEDKIADLVQLCRNLLLRYITISAGKPTALESEIGKLARSFNGHISEISTKFKEISKDSEFKNELNELKVNYKSYYTYLLLVELEQRLHTNEKWICPGRKDITIEHVLPQTIEGTEWEVKFTKDQFEVYKDRLGNLTLLGSSGNSKIKNKVFSEKKNFYKNSTDMKMTKNICEYDDWTVSEIIDRQAKMSDELLKVLSLDI